MDILDFINSKTIRDYLHEIEYQCDSMQSAWLVYQSRYKSFEEKHEAWQWIIDNMPDCEMPERRYSVSRPSLHGYLAELMNYRNEHKKRILKGKAPKHMQVPDEDLFKDAFESRWYFFPTPFKKGDIVYDCNYDPHLRDYCTGAFVLNGINNDPKDREKNMENQDSSDMVAYGWFQEENGTIYNEVMFNYMDLELFKGHLTGQERLLIALSNYVKGKISEELLLHAQRVLIMHDLGYNSLANWYTEEELELAGIAGLKVHDLTGSERKKRKKKIEKRWKDHSYT